jgi:hypothetical protein
VLEDHAASAQTSFAHHPQNSYDAYTVSAAPCRWRSSHGHRRHPRRSSRPWAWWTQRIWTSFRSCIRELPARSVSHSRLERACRGAPHTSACASVARYAHRSQPLPPNIQCTEMGWKQTPRRGVKLERLARGTFMAAVLTLLVAIAWNTGIGSTHGTGAQCGMSGCRWPQPACTVSSHRRLTRRRRTHPSARGSSHVTARKPSIRQQNLSRISHSSDASCGMRHAPALARA